MFDAIEWTFTILFSIEYCPGLFSLRNPFAYARSFFGFVDLFSILPTYLALFIPGAQDFSVVRTFRFLRLFRIFKHIRYMQEARVLMVTVKGSLPKAIYWAVSTLSTVGYGDIVPKTAAVFRRRCGVALSPPG